MALSSKVLALLFTISLISIPGRCQRVQSNTSSSGTRTSPVVTTLAIVGGIIGFVAVIVPVCVFFCYRVSKANEQRRRDFYAAAPSQHQAVYSNYSSTTAATNQQQAPTVLYNASHSHYHDHHSAGTNTRGGQQYQSRVLYDINHQDSRASAPQNTRYALILQLYSPTFPLIHMHWNALV